MEWLIAEYWPWLAVSALLGATASVALTLRKVEVHRPAGGAVPAASPEPEPEPERAVDPIRVAADHFDQREAQLPLETEHAEFGPGSAAPLADGSAPDASYTIKGIVQSMLFHTPESPYFGRARAEVWFDSEETARAAGFARWDED